MAAGVKVQLTELNEEVRRPRHTPVMYIINVPQVSRDYILYDAGKDFAQKRQ